MQYKTDKEVEKEFEDISQKSMWELVPNTPRKIMIEDKEMQRVFTQQKNFILSQRQQDREAIREWAENNKMTDTNSPEENDYILRLTDLLSFLDGLEEE